MCRYNFVNSPFFAAPWPSWLDLNLSELQRAARCKLAYVHLQLRNPETALAAAMQVLRPPLPHLYPSGSPPHWREQGDADVTLAACYAAEALSALGQEAEAGAWLAEVHGRQRREAASGTGAFDAVSAGPSACRAARLALCTNLAVSTLASHWRQPGLTGDTGAGPVEVTEAGELTAGVDGRVAMEVVRAAAGEAVQLAAASGLPGTSSGASSGDGRTASLLAAYVDMVEGRCESAVGLLRSLQL